MAHGHPWVWIDNLRNVQFMETRNYPRQESVLHSEVEALRWTMESMFQYSTCQSFETDCWLPWLRSPKLGQTLQLAGRIETLQICFPDFKIIHIRKAQNQISDSLARTARSFYRDLCFIGCFIPVWLLRPPQVWVIE